jgi:hypothetical protein
MREVLVLCEGHTEREFCNSVIAPYFRPLSKGSKMGSVFGHSIF